EAGAARGQDDVRGEREAAFERGPADHLVERVVTSDVFAHADEGALRVEEPRRVQSTGRVEHALGLAQASWERGEDGGGEAERVVGHRVRRAGADGVDARLAAQPARRRGEEVPRRAR